MGILDFLQSDGGQAGLLDFLRNNAQNQNMNAGIGSDAASYAQQPPPGLVPQMPPAVIMAQQDPAPQMVGRNQPSPLDGAAWPAGPVGAPSQKPMASGGTPMSANAAMPAPQPAAPMAFAPPPAAAPAPTQAATGPGFGDRLMNGAMGFLGNLHNGPIGALAGGAGALITGARTDPGGIAQQKEQKILTATAQALRLKGVDEATIQAAAVNPDLMKTLVTQHYGPGDRDFAFRQAESKRAQANDDRTFKLAERAATRADEGPVEQSGEREKAAAKYGLVPGTPEFKAYVLTGKLPEGDATISNQVTQRKAAAAQMGMAADHPAYNSFVLTGKMPREDAQPLTATDKQAILTADEGVLAARTGIDALKKAKEISPHAMGFKGAGALATPGSLLPSGLGGDTSRATVDLDNTVTSNALTQLKSIFGGNPTEGERAIMLQIQGSSSLPDSVRQKIYDRAIALAENRLKFNQQRADELRGGSFYKAPKAGAAPGSAPTAAPAAVNDPLGIL